MNRNRKDTRILPARYLKWFGVAILIGIAGGLVAQVVKWLVG